MMLFGPNVSHPFLRQYSLIIWFSVATHPLSFPVNTFDPSEWAFNQRQRGGPGRPLSSALNFEASDSLWPFPLTCNLHTTVQSFGIISHDYHTGSEQRLRGGRRATNGSHFEVQHAPNKFF